MARRWAGTWKLCRAMTTAAAPPAAGAPPEAARGFVIPDVVRWRATKFQAPVVGKEELEKASVKELQGGRLRAVAFFRSNFYCTRREISGQLHDLILLLYVGALCRKQQQVMLAFDNRVTSLAERLRNGSLEDALIWLRKDSTDWDQLRALEGSEFFRRPDDAVTLALKEDPEWGHVRYEPYDADYKPYEFKDLTVDEISSLIHALHQPESLLAKLMKPDPLLTHYENMHIAIEHARLFLLKSELPIRLGLDITYRDLSSHVQECGFHNCMKQRKANETLSKTLLLSAKESLDSEWFPFPSGVEAGLRKRTIHCHHLVCKQPFRRVQHETPAGCPADAHRLVRRVLKLRKPFLMGGPHDKLRDWKEVSAVLVDGTIDGTPEEVEHDIYEEWTNESPELRKVLMSES